MIRGSGTRMATRILVGCMAALLSTAAFAAGASDGKAAPAAAAAPAGPVPLTVWHDQGDKGVAWFNEMAAAYQKSNPNVKIESVTYPTQQWIEKSIAAINTNTAPDIIFNNYERVIKVEDQTGKILDLGAAFKDVQDRSFVTAQDLQISTYKGKMIILPIQRVQMAFGVRKSWLEAAGKPFPKTWSEMKELAELFTKGDPDKNGKAGDTFGFALQAANPRDLVHMIDLFTFGTGVSHTVIDPKGNITINEARHKELVKEILGLYWNYAPKDTINYSFGEMYQIIEGGKGGMFRVGDWNVAKWDRPDVLDGDFVIGPWPQFKAGDQNAVVLAGMRGAAVPENAKNRAEAVKFLQFMLSKDAQQLSLKHIGSAVRKDLDLSALGDHGKYFALGTAPTVAYDFPESLFTYYSGIEEIYHKALLKALADRNANVDAVLLQAEADMKAYIASKK